MSAVCLPFSANVNHGIYILSYVNYSGISARTLRKSLKPKEREEAAKRDASHLSYFYWVDGVMLPRGQKPKADTSQEAMAVKA